MSGITHGGSIKFVRMHGTANEFLVLDVLRRAVTAGTDLAAVARAACDRTAGLGADGMLVVEPVDGFAARMTVYNADGSVPEMCGNGLRCVGKLVADRGDAGREFTVLTGAGPRRIEVLSSAGDASDIRISLGRPIFEAARIPTALPGTPPIEVPLPLDGEWGALAPGAEASLRVTCVSMGNPHAVIFVEDPDAVPVERLGPLFERHPAFPNRTNVEFVSVTSPTELRLRVWERGCGETAACGTGAGAATVAAILTGRTDRRVSVRLRGGNLRIEWPEDAAEVSLTGEAVTVGDVTWPIARGR